MADDVINVDTSQGAVTLYLPNIMQGGIMSNPKRFYINDVGGYSATNNIILVGSNNDTTNGAASFSLQVNYSAAEVLFSNQTNWLINSDQTSASGAGTVTSVGLTMPTALFATPVVGSPITISGTFAPALATQSANTIFAGPSSGSLATPTFRSLVNADFPVSGVTAGTYNNVTVNAQGIVTSGSNVSYGTVTSVALTMPSIFSVGGSPITTSGTLAVTLADETANFVFAGPTTGAATTPTFRALVAADLPAGTGTVTSFSAGDLSPVFTTNVANPTTTPALTFSLSTQSANKVFAGPTTGSAAAPTFRSLVNADFPITGVIPSTYNTVQVNAQGLIIDGFNISYILSIEAGDLSPLFTTTVSPDNPNAMLNFFAINQNANLVYAGPTTGSAAAPTFRSLVAADIPALPYASSTLTNAHIFVGNGSNVATDVAVSGDVALANTGAITINNQAVTYAKIQNVTANKLLGRSNSGSGVMEEITLGTGLSYSGTTLNVAVSAADSFGITIDGQGSVIATGKYGQYVVPYNGTITGWQIFEISQTPVSSSIVIDTWRDTYASYPPDVANTIWGGSKPTLSSQTKNEATGLSIAVTAGDIFWFYVDSVTSALQVQLSIQITRT